MYYTDRLLQFPVRVEKPDPVFARALQQAIGGVEGEIRVCLQYFFQAWGNRGPAKHRDLLLNTATEEIAHIEMLATAVALNLEGAPLSIQEDISNDTAGGSVLNGMDMRHVLSAGLAALPADANGVPFDCSHVYASGNTAADMTANVAAEATGRALALRLYNMTDDPGMKEMLAYLMARDAYHQQQFLAVIEDMGGLAANLPNPQHAGAAGSAPDGVRLYHPRLQPRRLPSASGPVVARPFDRRPVGVFLPSHGAARRGTATGAAPARQRRPSRATPGGPNPARRDQTPTPQGGVRSSRKDQGRVRRFLIVHHGFAIVLEERVVRIIEPVFAKDAEDLARQASAWLALFPKGAHLTILQDGRPVA